MTDSTYASEQLRVIRNLMERATIYRSISAPTALVGGLLSFAGLALTAYAEFSLHHPLSRAEFRILWLVILVLTGLTNLIFLSRGASRRGEPFFSSGMKCAATSLAPAFLSAALLTFVIHRPIHLAMLWITLYGIALLATQHFAPRSLVVLGITFFLTGCGLLVMWKPLFLPSDHGEPSALLVSAIMAGTFGGYHLVYAAAVWALGEDRAEPVSPSTGSGNV